MKVQPLKLSASTVAILIAITLCGGTDNVSIAQVNNQDSAKIFELVSVADTIIKEESTKEIKVDDSWYIKGLEPKLSKTKQKMFWELSQKYKLDYILVLSFARVENNFTTKVSETNDYGYLQCNINNKKYCSEIAGRKLDFDDEYDSLEAGCIMLRNCFDSWIPSYKTDEKQLLLHVITSYNSGVSGTNKIVSRGGNLNKRIYTSNVMDTYKQYNLGNFDYDPYAEQERK